MSISVKNQKIEQHQRILDIRISLGTTFQLKLIILTFGSKFAQKEHFGLKAKKKMNTAIEFCIFELV